MKKGFNLSKIIFIVVLVIGIGIASLAIWSCVVSNSNKREIVATVTGKEVKTYNDKGKYLIFTEDEGVYEITDTLFRGRFDSSDLYGKIKENETYKFTVVGIRIKPLSMYPNILYADKVIDNSKP